MRRIFGILITVIGGLAGATSLDLEPLTGGTEETPFLIHFANLIPSPAVAGVASYRIVLPITKGTLHIRPAGSLETGTEVVNGDALSTTTELVWTPPTDLTGLSKNAFSVVAVNAAGTVLTTAGNVLVNLANTPDPTTLQAGTFTQPTSPQVTEDTPYVFTFDDFAITLAITDPDLDPLQLRITNVQHGTFSVPTPIILTAGQSVTWTPTADLFTEDYFRRDPPLSVCTVQAEQIGGAEATAPVIFSTAIQGVYETTPPDFGLSNMEPIVITRGIPCDFTADQLKSLMHGIDDVDRDADMFINTTATGIPQLTLWTIFDNMATENGDRFVSLAYVETLRLLVPETQPLGTFPLTNIYLGYRRQTPNRSLSDQIIPRITIVDPAAPAPPSSAAGGTGGCGLGALGGLLLVAGLACRRRRS